MLSDLGFLKMSACFLFFCWENEIKYVFLDTSATSQADYSGNTQDRIGTYCEDNYNRLELNGVKPFPCPESCKCNILKYIKNGVSNAITTGLKEDLRMELSAAKALEIYGRHCGQRYITVCRHKVLS